MLCSAATLQSLLLLLLLLLQEVLNDAQGAGSGTDEAGSSTPDINMLVSSVGKAVDSSPAHLSAVHFTKGHPGFRDK
jgi:hypothetical protein